MVVWDGLNTHASGAMRELVAARSWLRVFRLPPYASELNPVEPVWSNLKRSLANLTKHDIGQLTALIKTRLRRMQARRHISAEEASRLLSSHAARNQAHRAATDKSSTSHRNRQIVSESPAAHAYH